MATAPPSFLRRELNRWVMLILLLMIALVPLSYIARTWSPRTGFTSLILFGTHFQDCALLEIKALPVARKSLYGYDGQFYAQVAIDPTLRHPGLHRALDTPAYRSKRILLPILAHILGGGSPNAILQVYALLNLFFWIVLALALAWFLRPATPCVAVAIALILLTDGALFSVERALTDLPAATFLFLAIQIPEQWRGLSIGAALLTREMSLLGIGLLFDTPALRSEPSRRKQLLLNLFIALCPLLLWSAYVAFVIQFRHAGALTHFSWHLAGLIGALRRAYAQWMAHGFSFRAFAPVSLLVQAIYMWTRPDFKSPYWRMGILFAVLFPFLNTDCFPEPESCTRIVLPLTIAFNILLSQRYTRPNYFLWLFFGNVFLLDAAGKMILIGLGLRGV